MTPEQGPQLILKAHLVMVLMLVENVLLHLFKIRGAHGKVRVASLPFEISNRILFLQPQIRHSLQFFDPLGLRNGSAKAGQEMNMIFHSASDDGCTA